MKKQVGCLCCFPECKVGHKPAPHKRQRRRGRKLTIKLKLGLPARVPTAWPTRPRYPLCRSRKREVLGTELRNAPIPRRQEAGAPECWERRNVARRHLRIRRALSAVADFGSFCGKRVAVDGSCATRDEPLVNDLHIDPAISRKLKVSHVLQSLKELHLMLMIQK